MQATIKWVEDVNFLAESGSGHQVVVDGPESHGGRNAGARPMELILMGLGGCTSFDVMSILKKSRQEVTDCVAHLEAERADEVPAVFTKIKIHFVVSGRSLKEAAVARFVKKFTNLDQIPRPPYWKGYRVDPHAIEFWIANEFRLHTRFIYRRNKDGGWTAHWMCP